MPCGKTVRLISHQGSETWHHQKTSTPQTLLGLKPKRLTLGAGRGANRALPPCPAGKESGISHSGKLAVFVKSNRLLLQPRHSISGKVFHGNGNVSKEGLVQDCPWKLHSSQPLNNNSANSHRTANCSELFGT